MNEAGRAEDDSAARPEYRALRAGEENRDPPCIALFGEDGAQPWTEHEREQTDEKHGAKQAEYIAAITAEQIESRWQKQNREGEGEQYPDPDAAVDHHAD